MERSNFNQETERQPAIEQDRTKECAELLDRFAELLRALSRNYVLLKEWQTLLSLRNKQVSAVLDDFSDKIRAEVEAQYNTAKQIQESLRSKLDEVAAELRAKGLGFAIEGYEERLAILQ